MSYEPTPSTAGGAWIFREAKGANFYSDDQSGKWCIFCTPEEVDSAWSTVCQLLSERKLHAAKVSTAAARRVTGHATQVICVYTTDWQNRESVFQTLTTLREAGFLQPLKYKRDIDTMNPPSDPTKEFYYEG